MPHAKVLNSLPFDENTYVVIMTYSHPYDREILAYCLEKPHAYIGMVGSERKIITTQKKFVEAGIATADQLEEVNMPIGEDIAAEEPAEIAVSIAAKLISVKNEVLNG